ncbi:MAG: hypothetical protein ABSB42_18245 [Tepidisphaeraceae bacterium]
MLREISSPIVITLGGFGCAQRCPSAPAKVSIPRTPVDKAIIKLVLPFCDPIAYGWKRGDSKWQVSRDQLERHFKAIWTNKWSFDGRLDSNDLIKKLSGDEVIEHQRTGRLLLVRSYFKKGRLLIRFDFDQHGGQTDALAAMGWVKNNYLPSMVISLTEDGVSGYIWLKLPWGTNSFGESVPHCTMAEANAIREHLHEIVQPLIAKHGFKATAEVHGSFLKRIHFKDVNGCLTDPSQVAEKALGPQTNVRLPVFETVEQVREFAAAVVRCDPRDGRHDAGLAKLIAEGKAAAAACPKPTEILTKQQVWRRRQDNLYKLWDMYDDGRFDLALKALGILESNFNEKDDAMVQQVVDWRPRETPGRKKRCKLDRTVTPFNLNDKPSLARLVIMRAWQLLGITTKAQLELRKNEVLELAHALYQENHLSPNPRDRPRDARFKHTFKFWVRVFDGAKAGNGNDPYWFDEAAIRRVQTRLESSAEVMTAIATFNQGRMAKKNGKITTRILAIIACTVAKDTIVGKDGEVSKGDVPIDAIVAMLANPNFDLPTHSKVVGAGVRIILTVTKAIQRVAEAIKPRFQFGNGVCKRIEGQAAKYRILKWDWFTFLGPAPAKTLAPPQTTLNTQRKPAASITYDGGGAPLYTFSSLQYKGGSSPGPASETGSTIIFNSREDMEEANYQELLERGLV